MNEDERTEINREDRKPEDTGRVHKKAQLVNDETSNVNEKAHERSYITTSDKPNMEVHHPHHVTHKKKWTEYLLEFSMLFLAVFLGFVAENLRERQVENRREVEYIRSLTADLDDDVHNLDSMIAFEETGLQQLDTLIDLLDNPSLAKQNGDEIYYVAREGPREYPFPVNSRTLDQLKSSGGFLLIRNVGASNQVINYYNHYSPIKLLEDNYRLEFDDYKRVAAKIFDPAILRRQENGVSDIMRSNDNPSLLNYDANLLKELGFHTVQMSGSRRSKLRMLRVQKAEAVQLKSYLGEEYNLKNE
ncbi:MAG TPA: hypothetical protein VEV83_12725 [Parafilimonas sp.]|nr:hypothetical protein [Parafilimonas sp.]